MSKILEIAGLSVSVSGKQVLKNVTLALQEGEVAALRGQNGSGKTSLAMTLLGDSRYQVLDGKIRLGKSDLLKMGVDERARDGLFVAWQNPVTIPGVSLFNLAKAAYESHGGKIAKLTEFRDKLVEIGEEVGLKNMDIGRSFNDGFSGGERKRIELLLCLLLKPRLVVLDEIDSGLDENGREMVANIVKKMKKEGTGFIIISHYKEWVEHIEVDQVWEIRNGKLQTGV